jgi:predicted enzyme related to lactoylglutathione lyase
MHVQQFVVNVNSADPERLASFYRDVVGLEPAPDVGPGAFMAGSSSFIALIIEGHDAIRGPAVEPARVLLNFFVADAAAEQRGLQAKGVHFSREATLEPGFGYVATFADPDGNTCQLMQLTA